MQLAFSPDGATLASVGLDDQNSLALHDWKSGTVLARVRSGGDKVFGLAFQPGGEGNPLDDSRLVTCGVGRAQVQLLMWLLLSDRKPLAVPLTPPGRSPLTLHFVAPWGWLAQESAHSSFVEVQYLHDRGVALCLQRRAAFRVPCASFVQEVCS